MKKNGKKADRISVFVETRSKPDGSIADPESIELIVRKKIFVGIFLHFNSLHFYRYFMF